MSANKQKQSRWSSRFSYIMATTGAAVGLGNIWLFPYVAGQNGGSAFVGLYLFFVAVVGIPAMMAETLLGRLGRRNAVDSLASLAQDSRVSPKWAYLGWWGAVGLLLTLSFYSVVSGWTVAYAIKAMKGVFQQQSPAAIGSIWQAFLGSPVEGIFWQGCFVWMTLWIVGRGLKQGIEKACNYLMPALFVLLFGMMLYAIVCFDGRQAAHFLFHFDVSQLNAQVALEALGLAFFTLATGAGCLLVYGAYLKEETPIFSSMVTVAVLDILVAFAAAMAIFPLVFAYGLAPEGGPGLMFKVLPIAFAQLQGGAVIGSLFFILLWFAAWTSTISMAEPLVLLLIEKWGCKRQQAAVIVGTMVFILGALASLSFNLLSTFQPGGSTIFEWMTQVVTHAILPIGVLLFALFAGYCLSLEQVYRGLRIQHPSAQLIFHLLLRYAVPLAILCILFESTI